jgi:hypothetical protein
MPIVFAISLLYFLLRKSKPLYSRSWPESGGILLPVDEEVRKDLEATLGARRELGREHEDQLIDAFLERLDRRLADRVGESERSLKRRRDHQKEMILGAMALSIPLIAIAGGIAGLAGIAFVCAALAVIGVVASRS